MFSNSKILKISIHGFLISLQNPLKKFAYGSSETSGFFMEPSDQAFLNSYEANMKPLLKPQKYLILLSNYVTFCKHRSAMDPSMETP